MPYRPEERYHLQPWYVKLWRLRGLLPVPYRALKMWLRFKGTRPLKECWGIELGSAEYHSLGNWYYLDELE